MLIVAVDAETGEPVVFDRHGGIDLVDAVAASTSGPGGPPYRIGTNRYIDGGDRANENADRQRDSGGCWCWHRSAADRACEGMGHPSGSAGGRSARSRQQVETIFPDGSSRDVFAVGGNVMDLSTRPPVAEPGYNQGRALAEELTGFWR